RVGGSRSSNSAGSTESAEAISITRPRRGSFLPFSTRERYGAGLPTRSPSSSRVRLAFFRWNRRRRPRTIGSRVVVLLISVLGRKIARSYLREATDAGCERENTTCL